MRKLPLLCSLAALLLSAAALAAVLLAPRAGEDAPSATDAYRLEKLNAVSDLVLERQVVPSDYLRYLDEELAAAVEEYNWQLANTKSAAVAYAIDVADSFARQAEEDGMYAGYARYLEQGDNYFRFVEEFSTAILYPSSDRSWLTLSGTVSGYPAGQESGGSGGLWATGVMIDPAVPTEALFSAADALLDQMDAARAAF